MGPNFDLSSLCVGVRVGAGGFGARGHLRVNEEMEYGIGKPRAFSTTEEDSGIFLGIDIPRQMREVGTRDENLHVCHVITSSCTWEKLDTFSLFIYFPI